MVMRHLECRIGEKFYHSAECLARKKYAQTTLNIQKFSFASGNARLVRYNGSQYVFGVCAGRFETHVAAGYDNQPFPTKASANQQVGILNDQNAGTIHVRAEFETVSASGRAVETM